MSLLSRLFSRPPGPDPAPSRGAIAEGTPQSRAADGGPRPAAIDLRQSQDPRECYELGCALEKSGDPKGAELAFRRAAQLAPDAAGLHFKLATALRDQGRPVEAEAPAREATRIAPDMPQGWCVLGSVLSRQARHEEAAEHFRRAIELLPDYDAAWRGLLFSMTYSDQWTAREVYEAHLRSASRFGPAAPARLERPRPGARIRLGYLSADFCQHSVAHFIEPVLSHHDRSRFEVFCYDNGAREDQVTRRLQACAEHWRSVSEMADDQLEQAIRADRLDLLVELSGNTDGHRLGVLARRVAPVQVTYLGYPNTTGISAIDYRITDARADPPGGSDHLHVEQLVRLADSFLCYAPPMMQIGPRTPPYRTNGYVTFGSFNNFPKLGPATLSLWTQILTALPASMLLVKSHGLHDPGLRALLLERLRSSGIAPERAVIVPPHDDHGAHMRAYGQIDIALDTFPYNGTTTTLDALWMGVPVVTLAGDRHAARVGESILSTLGLPELVARSGAEYVSGTLRLANDPERLDALAHSLRQRLISSPLAAGAQFTSRLEQAYLQMVDAAAATV